MDDNTVELSFFCKIKGKIVNELFNKPQLSINSLVAIPHALSKKAVDKIGWKNLSIPPLAQAIAMKEGLSIICPSFVDVITTNKIRPELHLDLELGTPYSPIENVIIGDHLSAINYLINKSGNRGGFIDNRIRGNISKIMRRMTCKRSAIICDESEGNTKELLTIIDNLRNAGANEINVISYDDNGLKRKLIGEKGVNFIHLMRNQGSFITRLVGTALSTGQCILFTDGKTLLSPNQFSDYFNAIENGADVALRNTSYLLDNPKSIDPLNSIEFFLNIILKKADLLNNSLINFPHAMHRKVIEKITPHSLLIPPLAYVKMIENNFVVHSVSTNEQIKTNNHDINILLGDHIEAIRYFLSRTNDRGNFSNGNRNFKILERSYDKWNISIDKKKIKIGIIGLGYVGLPLAQLFLEKDHIVYGIDTDESKINKINNFKSYLADFSDSDIKNMMDTKNFHVSSSYKNLIDTDAIILCVPTPLKENNEPDLRFIHDALNNLSPYLKAGQLIVLESSTYPGTTEEEICPQIENKGFIIGENIFVAYSPERINPGNNAFKLQQIPKIIGGVTSACTLLAKEIYGSVFDSIIEVSSSRAAEMSKLLENSQRLINISFMNEISMLCHEMNLDIWEIIDACSTKPFGFTPYYPGPGIGGHCIPVDPLYLSWKAKEYGIDLTAVETAQSINNSMPYFITKKLNDFLEKPLSKCNILIIGVTYKKDVNDVRESPATRIMEHLIKIKSNVNYHDPLIPHLSLLGKQLTSVPISKSELEKYDCCVILTDHSNLPMNEIIAHSKLILDTRNATKDFNNPGNIIK